MKPYFVPVRLALLLALVLLLPGCGKKEDASTAQDAETILRVMLAELAEYGEADALRWYLEPDDVDGYLKDCYKLGDIPWVDGAVVRIEGARAFELAVLRVDEDNVEPVVKALQEYLVSRQAAFTGYFPEQANMAENGQILTRGGWIALDVCVEMETAKNAFESCFGNGVNAVGIPAVLGPEQEELCSDGRLAYVDPRTDDMTVFDSAKILAAWESGDHSGLTQEEEAVLDAAGQVLKEWTKPNMGDYEKELAVYCWLTTHVDYDWSHYTKRGAPRTSYEPYGPLVEGKGVCLGYATTFQLLMDMAEVECMTVVGASFRNQGNHAWNMVQLDGTWYCLDPTWDHINVDQDYPPEELRPMYRYFNVTSDYMAFTDHQWDYDSVPEAAAEYYGQGT